MADSDFDQFVKDFDGMVEVLMDRMELSDISVDGKNLIYTDLLEKIIRRIRGREFFQKTYIKTAPPMESAGVLERTLQYYISLSGEFCYRVDRHRMIGAVDPNDFRYTGVFAITKALWSSSTQTSKYFRSAEEAFGWIQEKMESKKERILKGEF